MSESENFSCSHNKANGIDTLPHNFLGINPDALNVSAGLQRSMADLRHGQAQLGFVVTEMVVSGIRRYEDADVVRHIHRGAALSQLLLQDSLPDSPSREEHLISLIDLEPIPNPARDIFYDVRDALAESRRKAVLSPKWEAQGTITPEERVQNEMVFAQQLDGVLIKAGLNDVFETAVSGLTGPGLEEPTRLLDAKYGAALVALGVGYMEA